MENEKILYHFDRPYVDEPLKFREIRLIQIGRKYCGVGGVVASHLHEKWFELTLILSGKGTVYANGQACSVSANDIHLSFPYEFHEIRADPDHDLRYDYFAFYCEGGALEEDLEKIRQSHLGNPNRVFHNETIQTAVRNALSEFNAEFAYRNELLESIFRQIIIHTVREVSDIQQSPLEISDATMLCYRVMNYIDTHIYTLRNLTEVSAFLNYNYDYLAALFKKTTKQKLSDYYIDRKLEMARCFLLENKKKISEIAELANYASVFVFSKAFKKKYGQSPAKYRQQFLRNRG